MIFIKNKMLEKQRLCIGEKLEPFTIVRLASGLIAYVTLDGLIAEDGLMYLIDDDEEYFIVKTPAELLAEAAKQYIQTKQETN